MRRTHPQTNMRADAARLWDSLMETAKIDPGLRGGNNLQTLTATHRDLS